MDKIEKLTKSLNSLFEYLDNEYSINLGGCCRVAAKLAEELEYRGIEFHVGFGYINEEDVEYMRELGNLEDYTKDVIYFEDYPVPDHFSILVKDSIINSMEGCNEDNYVFYTLSSLDLYRIYDVECWNPTFNTAKIVYVDKFIDIIFRQYDSDDL